MKTGDTVHLKSGGPTMTVKDVTGNNVECVWWNQIVGNYTSATFLLPMLEPVALGS